MFSSCRSTPTPARPRFDEATIQAATEELEQLRRELETEAGPADVAHLERMVRWSRACMLLGLASAWIVPNPISALLISQAKFSRWTMLGHHVLHRAYDRLPGAERYHSETFARGWRRFGDWFDWILPEAWVKEHNILHHHHLGAELDPDKVEANLDWLRAMRAPTWFKYGVLAFFACTWKLLFWPLNTLEELLVPAARDERGRPLPVRLRELSLLAPRGDGLRSSLAGQLVLRCVLPYGLWTFVALPLLFLPLGLLAVTNVLLNLLLAELLTNVHGFIMLVTNHSGEDLPRFSGKCRDKREFMLRQIVGSTNYPTGGDLRDFIHGYLNYQIEHHLWPQMTMLQLRRAQPRVRAICERHGIPYVQEPVLRRLRKAAAVMVGAADMAQVRLVAESQPGVAETPSSLSEAA